MIDISKFVFLDIETTGLNFNEHQILELSYAVGDGEIITLYNPDTDSIFSNADPRAIKVNRYFERFAGEGYGSWYQLPRSFFDYIIPGVKRGDMDDEPYVYLALSTSHYDAWDDFLALIKGKVLVGANPGFDRAFLEKFFGEPLSANHRLFDIEAFYTGRMFMLNQVLTAGLFHGDQEMFDAWTKITGFKDICIDFNVDPGDHTSAGDVRATREVWKKLVGLE